MPKGSPKIVTQQEAQDALVSTLERIIVQASNALKVLKKFERQPKS